KQWFTIAVRKPPGGPPWAWIVELLNFPPYDGSYHDYHPPLHHRRSGSLRRHPLCGAHVAHHESRWLGCVRDEGPASAGKLVAGGRGHFGAEILSPGGRTGQDGAGSRSWSPGMVAKESTRSR